MKTESKLYIQCIFMWIREAQMNWQENTLIKIHADIILFTNEMHFKDIKSKSKQKIETKQCC